MPKREILIFENSFKVTNFFIKKWKELALESIAKNNRFTVALSGGKTPVEFYCKLSGLRDFDLWQKTHIFLTDERYVSFDDPASNFGMIRKNILNYISIPDENIHPVGTYHQDIDLSAKQYENHLNQFFQTEENGLPAFDLILLGVGEDGHVASLFPYDKGVDEVKRLVINVDCEHLDTKRISLTFPVINNARFLIFLVTGEKKSEIIKKIIEKKKEDIDFPALKVNPVNGEILFLLDSKASRQLSYGESFSYVDQAISI